MVRLGAIWESFGRATGEDHPMRPSGVSHQREKNWKVGPVRSTSTPSQTNARTCLVKEDTCPNGY